MVKTLCCPTPPPPPPPPTPYPTPPHTPPPPTNTHPNPNQLQHIPPHTHPPTNIHVQIRTSLQKYVYTYTWTYVPCTQDPIQQDSFLPAYTCTYIHMRIHTACHVIMSTSQPPHNYIIVPLPVTNLSHEHTANSQQSAHDLIRLLKIDTGLTLQAKHWYDSLGIFSDFRSLSFPPHSPKTLM